MKQNGRQRMVCPRCRKAQDILSYVPLRKVEFFDEETNEIYKCPACKWVFSPTDPPAPLMVEELREEVAADA